VSRGCEGGKTNIGLVFSNGRILLLSLAPFSDHVNSEIEKITLATPSGSPQAPPCIIIQHIQLLHTAVNNEAP